MMGIFEILTTLAGCAACLVGIAITVAIVILIIYLVQKQNKPSSPEAHDNAG